MLSPKEIAAYALSNKNCASHLEYLHTIVREKTDGTFLCTPQDIPLCIYHCRKHCARNLIPYLVSLTKLRNTVHGQLFCFYIPIETEAFYAIDDINESDKSKDIKLDNSQDIKLNKSQDTNRQKFNYVFNYISGVNIIVCYSDEKYTMYVNIDSSIELDNHVPRKAYNVKENINAFLNGIKSHTLSFDLVKERPELSRFTINIKSVKCLARIVSNLVYIVAINTVALIFVELSLRDGRRMLILNQLPRICGSV